MDAAFIYFDFSNHHSQRFDIMIIVVPGYFLLGSIPIVKTTFYETFCTSITISIVLELMTFSTNAITTSSSTYVLKHVFLGCRHLLHSHKSLKSVIFNVEKWPLVEVNILSYIPWWYRHLNARSKTFITYSI